MSKLGDDASMLTYENLDIFRLVVEGGFMTPAHLEGVEAGTLSIEVLNFIKISCSTWYMSSYAFIFSGTFIFICYMKVLKLLVH